MNHTLDLGLFSSDLRQVARRALYSRYVYEIVVQCNMKLLPKKYHSRIFSVFLKLGEYLCIYDDKFSPLILLRISEKVSGFIHVGVNKLNEGKKAGQYFLKICASNVYFAAYHTTCNRQRNYSAAKLISLDFPSAAHNYSNSPIMALVIYTASALILGAFKLYSSLSGRLCMKYGYYLLQDW